MFKEFTENLDDYKSYSPTSSCYLDGRYFYKVFARYPGILPHPLHLSIRSNDKLYISMKQSNVNTEYPGLLRLVIETSTSRHSNLLILDYNNGIVYRFEPLGKDSEYFNEINSMVENYLNFFFDMKLEVIDIDLRTVLDEKNESCIRRGEKSGFCTAYIIMYAYAYLHGQDFDPSNVLKFAHKIEETYGSLPKHGEEKEYGLLTGDDNQNQLRNVLIGAGSGALIGGVAAGGKGALAGGLGGALIGAII